MLEMNPELYHYQLPKELIATAPAEPRDHSRLFIYDTATGKITFDYFYNLAAHLPSDAFLVFNTTKVVPARLAVKKETGGKAELLLMVNELRPGDRLIKGLSDRKLTVGQKLSIDAEHALLVDHQDEKVFFFRPLFPIEKLETVLLAAGITPIPKYIGNTGLTEDALRQRYQSIFAQNSGSIAAPTASLHFTQDVFDSLKKKAIPHLEVTLHVGLGTFAPIDQHNIDEKKLHQEWYELSEPNTTQLASYKTAGRKCFAVGTTSVRTLESYGRSGTPHGFTDIFIYPPYSFHYVQGMITNFHLPDSSLMMLVEAFLQSKNAPHHLKDLYEIALKKRFRFYSFGDAMVIL